MALASTPLIGDQKNLKSVEKRGVTLHNYPQALYANAGKISDVLNDAAQSGKRLGAQVMLVDKLDTPTKATIFVAAGSDPDSKWIAVKDVIGTQADVTPA